MYTITQHTLLRYSTRSTHLIYSFTKYDVATYVLVRYDTLLLSLPYRCFI